MDLYFAPLACSLSSRIALHFQQHLAKPETR